MVRAIVGVVVGYALWSVLWIVGNQLFFAEAARAVSERHERYEPMLPLLAILGQSVVCSLAAGVVCGVIAAGRALSAAVCLGVALAATGVVFQAGIWNLMPSWYHSSFIGLLLPVTVLGALLVRRPGSARGCCLTH